MTQPNRYMTKTKRQYEILEHLRNASKELAWLNQMALRGDLIGSSEWNSIVIDFRNLEAKCNGNR